LPAGSWGILTYTDGLIEARDDGDWLGTDGLCRLIEQYLGAGGLPTGLPEWLVAEAERRNGGPLADDVAMLLLTGDNTAPLAMSTAGALQRQPTTGLLADSSVVVDVTTATTRESSENMPANAALADATTSVTPNPGSHA
jgi:hypothetical protein